MKAPSLLCNDLWLGLLSQTRAGYCAAFSRNKIQGNRENYRTTPIDISQLAITLQIKKGVLQLVIV